MCSIYMYIPTVPDASGSLRLRSISLVVVVIKGVEIAYL